MTLAHLKVAENRAELLPRIPLLMAIRDKLAFALQEERWTDPDEEVAEAAAPWKSTAPRNTVRLVPLLSSWA